MTRKYIKLDGDEWATFKIPTAHRLGGGTWMYIHMKSDRNESYFQNNAEFDSSLAVEWNEAKADTRLF